MDRVSSVIVFPFSVAVTVAALENLHSAHVPIQNEGHVQSVLLCLPFCILDLG